MQGEFLKTTNLYNWIPLSFCARASTKTRLGVNCNYFILFFFITFYLLQGIIHRDLKPVNLFLDSHGRIKIGDFGLATTHSITRGGMGPDVLDANDKSQSPKSSSAAKESMTGKVGTTLYVAPELGKRAGVRVKYSQKVDLYSLGIIFFEMCYKPLTTSMERVHVLGNLRTVSCCLLLGNINVSLQSTRGPHG